MTKKQKAFFDYLQKLKAEERENTKFAKNYSSNGYSLTEYELNKALQDFVSGGQNE